MVSESNFNCCEYAGIHGQCIAAREPPFPEVETLSGMHVISMACGGHHSAAISERWQLFTWGGGAFGKLGHGNRLAKTKPTKVQVSAKLVQARRERAVRGRDPH